MHPLLRSRAEAQLGLFTAADALAAGYGHTEVQRLCRSGAWQRLRRGVHAAAPTLVAAEQGATATGWSAWRSCSLSAARPRR